MDTLPSSLRASGPVKTSDDRKLLFLINKAQGWGGTCCAEGSTPIWRSSRRTRRCSASSTRRLRSLIRLTRRRHRRSACAPRGAAQRMSGRAGCLKPTGLRMQNDLPAPPSSCASFQHQSSRRSRSCSPALAAARNACHVHTHRAL